MLCIRRCVMCVVRQVLCVVCIVCFGFGALCAVLPQVCMCMCIVCSVVCVLYVCASSLYTLGPQHERDAYKGLIATRLDSGFVWIFHKICMKARKYQIKARGKQ